MPCLPRQHLVAPYGAGLLAAVCALAFGCAAAVAQSAASDYPDPLSPKLQTDPRHPPRFQKITGPGLTPLGPPATFTEQPSAAGDTGYDSTNSRMAKAKAGARKMPKPKASKGDQALVSGSAPAPVVSPYQKPFHASGNAAYASAPGAPPVELGPIRKMPAKRKAHSEPDNPYAPLGIKAGAFTLFPAIELIGGYDTNPAQDTSARGAWLYTVAPELQLQSNWLRHELKADLRGSYTGYSPDFEPTLSRPYVNGKVDGRVDVTKTTRIDLGGLVLASTDNPGSPNLQAGLARLPIYTAYGGSVGVGQKFNRFDLSLKGDAARTAYQDSSLTDGSTASNEDRNYDQYGVILRGGYELSPGVTPFIELGADTRRHDLVFDRSGNKRNSKGVTGLVGTSFELSRLLTGVFSLGYTKRDYEDPRLEQLSGLIGDASLIWATNSLTTVKFKAASSVGESTVAGVSGVLYRDLGLQVDHSFRRWLIGSVKLGFGFDDYVGSPREDKRFSAGASLTYKLSRYVQLKGEFRQDWRRSNISGNDYNASIFMLGLRFQQ